MESSRDWHAELVETLGLSRRVHNCIQRRGVKTIGQLCRMSEAELLANQSWGETTLLEVRARLAELGLRLRDDGSPRILG